MITQTLKGLSFFAAFAGIQGAVPLRAAVNMISVEHRVWGNAGESPTYFYDEAGPAPLFRDISVPTSDDYGIIYNYASSSASDWSVDAYRIGNGSQADAYAQNTYVFKPHSREISILLNGVIGVWWFENSAKMTLINISTNTPVISYLSPSYTRISPFPLGVDDMVDYPFSWNTTLEVNPEHEYKLIISVSAHRGEGGDGSASLTLTLVPESGTTLLTGIAVLFLCGRRRRPVRSSVPVLLPGPTAV